MAVLRTHKKVYAQLNMTESPFSGLEQMMDALEEPYRFAGEFDANGFVQNLMSAGSYLLLVWVRNQISKNYTDVNDDEIEILD